MVDVFLKMNEELVLFNNPNVIVCFAVIVVLLLLLMFSYMRQEKLRLHEMTARRIGFEERKLSLLTEFSKGLVFTLDLEQDTAVLEGGAEILKEPKSQLSGCMDFLRENSSRFAVHPENVFQLLEQISSGKKQISESILVKGELYQKELPVWLHIRAKRILSGVDNRELLFGFICREEERDKAEEAWDHKLRDGATGFYNQYGIKSELTRLFAGAASGVRYAFVLLTLTEYDRYKTDFPEDLLQRVLDRMSIGLKKMFREEDRLARISENEFVVCMSHVTSREDVLQKLQLLEKHLNEVHRQAEGGILKLEKKISIYPMDGENYESLLDAARNQ